MNPDLEQALQVGGFTTEHSHGQIVFRSIEGPPRTVIWRISDERLARHAASLTSGAHAAWGSNRARGEWLMAVHLLEALETFAGDRGEITIDRAGLRVTPTP